MMLGLSTKRSFIRHRQRRRRNTEVWLDNLRRTGGDESTTPRITSVEELQQLTHELVLDASQTLRRYRAPRRSPVRILERTACSPKRGRPEDEPLPESDLDDESEGEVTSDADTLTILMRWHDETRHTDMTQAFGVYPQTISAGSLSSEAVRTSSDEGERQRTSCYMCNCDIGERRKGNKEAEKKVYLPCGHWFGHICLYGWLSHRSDAVGPVRCPRPGCSTIRHCCTHLATPSIHKPLIVYNSSGATKIPWDCQFCSTDLGKELREAVSRASIRACKASTGRYFTSFLKRMYAKQLAIAEHELQTGERAWAAANWKRIIEAPLIKLVADDPVESELNEVDNETSIWRQSWGTEGSSSQ